MRTQSHTHTRIHTHTLTRLTTHTQGLWATYYSTDATATANNASDNTIYPIAAAPHYFLSFDDSIDGFVHAPSCANESYRIRWAGVLRPPRAQTYTIYAQRQELHERVKVWVDNVLLIDMWRSLGEGNEMSGTVGLGAAHGYHQIRVEYVANKNGKGVQLLWETESQIKGKVEDALFSGAEKPAEMSEYLFKSFPANGCKVRIGSTIVVDTLSANSATPSPSNNGIMLHSDAWYAIEMEYTDVKDTWQTNLSWAFRGENYVAIPSSHLMYPVSHIHASPFFVYVAAERATAEMSEFNPPTRDNLDVGTEFSIDVLAKDQYGNRVVSGDEKFVGCISYRKDTLFAASLGRRVTRESLTIVQELPHASRNLYSQHAVVTRAGSATLSVKLIVAAGIAATYFSDTDLSPSAAVKAAHLPSIDFSAAPFQSPFASSLPVNSTYSVRWAGMLHPLRTHLYTMFAQKKAAEERVKVWVDNVLLIDMWSSLGGGNEMSGTVNFASTAGYYDIKVEYSSGLSINFSNLTVVEHGLQLQWRANTTGRNDSRYVINASEYAVASSVPLCFTPSVYSFPIDFNPVRCRVASSTARGNGISIATVGGNSRFTVVARDLYGNEMQPDYRMHTLQAHGMSKFPITGNVMWNGSEYHVEYEATSRGYTSLAVHMRCTDSFEQIPQSPFNITVKQAARFDSSVSRIISSSVTIVTAGAPATFKISLRDKFGSPWYSKKAGLIANFDGKGVFHYVSAIRNTGTVVSVLSSSSFYLYDDVNDALSTAQNSGEYNGLFISIGAESRDISSCIISIPNSNPLITVSKAFTHLPSEGTGYQIYSATDPNPSKDGDGIDLVMTYTSSGMYLMDVKETVGDGLEGTYFLGDFDAAIFSRVDKIVDFQWSTLSPMVPFIKNGEKGNVQFSTRWTGFLYSSIAQEHSFFANLAGTDDRVKLWIDSNIVLDQWSSLTGKIKPVVLEENCWDREGQIEICTCVCNETAVTCYSTTTCWSGACTCTWSIEPSGVARIDNPWIMHSVVLEYKNTAKSSSISLQWSTNGVGGNIEQQVIPETYLRPSAVHLNGSPLEINVVPGEVSFQQSIADIQHSILTAGTNAQFELMARDFYGNSRNFDHRRSEIIARLIYDQAVNPTFNAGIRIPAVHASLFRNISMVQGGYVFNITPQVASRSVPLFASLVTAGGISATYYNDADLQPSAAIKATIHPTIDFSSPPFFSPTASLPTNSSYSIRWAGMLRPIHAETYTVQASRQHAEERVKVWIDNVLLIDMWSSLSDGNELSGTIYFQTAGEYYDIKVEYKRVQQLNTDVSQGVHLQWKRAFDNLTVVPVSALYQERSIGAHRRVSVRASQVCNSVSTSSGPSLMTAGVQATFHIFLRDMFLNVQTESSQLVAGSLFSGEISEDFGQPWAFKEGQYTVDESCAVLTVLEPADARGQVSLSVDTTLSGAHSLSMVLATRGGLLGAYQNGCVALEADLVLQRVDPVISFEWDAALASVPELDASSFSVQWQGFIHVPGDDTYTFSVISNGAVELYINGITILDFSASAVGQRERTTLLLANRLYTINLRYATRTKESYLQLRWRSDIYVQDEVVPSTNLMHSPKPLAVSPFQSSISVRPAQTCAINSYVTGVTLTLSTAGVYSNFAIKCRDEYGNLRRDEDDSFIVKMAPPLERTMDLQATLSYSEASHVVTYRQTRAGTQMINAYLIGGMGLEATYYSGTGEELVEKNAAGHMSGTNINFTVNSGQRLTDVSLAAASPFGVRWQGFISLPYVQTYTFFPVLANESDRVRIWIDNQLILDAWTSLSAIVPIVSISAEPHHSLPGNNVSLLVEYRHAHGNAGLVLKWSTTNFTKMTLSSCRAVGLTLSLQQDCVTGATALGYSYQSISEMRVLYWPPWPAGCIWETATSTVYYNTAPNLEVCSDDYVCLCGGYIAEQVVTHDNLVQTYQLSSQMLTFVEGGLHATFYDYPDLTIPKMTLQTGGIDFSSAACSRIECVVDDFYPSVSVKLFNDDDHVSGRWGGFLKVPYPQTFTFDAKLLESDERVKIWIDNKLIIDSWDSLSTMVISQTMDFRCADDTFLPLKVEYKDISGAQGLKIFWQTQEMAVVHRNLLPSSRLAVGVQRAALPIALTIQPDVFCSVTSLQFGSSLSVSTAGAVHSFMLFAKDKFRNFRTIDEDDVSNLQVVQVSHDWREWTVDQGVTLSTRGNVLLSPDKLSYIGQYRSITRAGASMLFATFANVGGLAATFYDDMTFSEASAVKSVAPYAYSSFLILAGANELPGTVQGTQPPLTSDGGYALSLSESTDYSVRWNGFVRPEYSGVYSVYLGFGIAREDRARLWIDNRLIIDQWATFGTDFQDGSAFDIPLLIEIGASFHFQIPEEYYQIEIEYKHRKGPQMISLMWANAQEGLPRSYIQTDRLAWGLNSPGSPWPVTICPAATCATQSYAQGTDITVSTAGQHHTFTIHSRDEFLNYKDEGGDFYVVRIYSCCGPEIRTGRLDDQNNGEYSVSYTSLTRSGANTVFATLAVAGGLSSTYYDDPHMHLPRKIQVDPIVSLYAAFGRSPSAPLSTFDLFGARWAGFIMATQSGLYNFRTMIGGDDERVKLWIDNKMVIDAWTSLNTQHPKGSMLINANLSNWYPVELKYRQYAGTARLELEWSAPLIANTIIPLDNLYQSYTLTGFPTSSINQPARACADNSEAFAVGLTLAKICADASFTITARDSFSNPITADQEEWYVRLTNAPNRNYVNLPDSFTYPGTTMWAKNSRYIASYISQGTGNWNFISLLEGPFLSATYYDSPNLNASTASTSMIQETIDFSSACQLCQGVACHCTLPKGVTIDGRTYCDQAGFSVRWAGFITPPDLGLYALRFKLRARIETDYEGRVALGSDERVRLWVDNKIVFDQWDSLSKDEFVSNFRFSRTGVHDLKMEFSKQPNPNIAQYGEDWKLSWLYQESDFAINHVIPASVYSYGNDILQQPFQYFVDPPKVAYATPLNGPAIGTTLVQIFGKFFGEKEPEVCTRTVFLGSTGIDSDDGRVQWASSSSIKAFTAPGVGCCHNITVLLLGMESEVNGLARFTYDAAFVTGIRLANAAATGEAMLTVVGGSFGAIDYTPRSRVGGTACTSTSWHSDSSLECTVPSGNNDGDDLDMGILVTVSNQIMRPGATLTRGFTYDEPVMSVIAPANAMVEGGRNITVFGSAIAPTFDPSPESRTGGTASENTIWLSESSIQCRVSTGVSKDKKIVVSLEIFIDTTSDIFSFDTPGLMPNASYNQPPSFNQSIITVSGINFAFEDRTSRARIAPSDTTNYMTDEHKANQGTGTVMTTWISNTAMRCRAAAGLQATHKMTITTGMLESQLQGQISEVFSYDNGYVSSVTPTGLDAGGSTSYHSYLGSCELGTAGMFPFCICILRRNYGVVHRDGNLMTILICVLWNVGGYYSSKSIAKYICDQTLNLGLCPGSTS